MDRKEVYEAAELYLNANKTLYGKVYFNIKQILIVILLTVLAIVSGYSLASTSQDCSTQSVSRSQ